MPATISALPSLSTSATTGFSMPVRLRDMARTAPRRLAVVDAELALVVVETSAAPSPLKSNTLDEVARLESSSLSRFQPLCRHTQWPMVLLHTAAGSQSVVVGAAAARIARRIGVVRAAG